jgi:hypothetical protein
MYACMYECMQATSTRQPRQVNILTVATKLFAVPLDLCHKMYAYVFIYVCMYVYATQVTINAY